MNELKKEQIKKTLKETKLRRKSQLCKVFTQNRSIMLKC